MSGSSVFLFTFFIIALFVIIIELFQYISQKFSLPQVLGEIIAGLIIGPSALYLFSFEAPEKTLFVKYGFVSLHEMETTVTVIEFIAEAAALFLLFEVGLEMEVKKLKRVGKEAFFVAVIGMFIAFLSGFLYFLTFSNYFSGEKYPSWVVGVFLGGVLTATSIGISIRVMIEMGRIHTRSTRVLVGSAVIDDILALILYSVLLGVFYEETAGKNETPIFALLKILGSILLFVVIVFASYKLVFPVFYNHAIKTVDRYFTLTLSLFMIFFLAWLAGLLYLAPIIGAFTAGILIGTNKKVERNAVELIKPISRWFIPMFFLAVGIRVNLASINSWALLGLGLLLAFIAILAKVIGSGLGSFIFTKNPMESLEIGLGMAPRGEVILLLATELFFLEIFDEVLFTQITLVVIISSFLVPLSLKYILKRMNTSPSHSGQSTNTNIGGKQNE